MSNLLIKLWNEIKDRGEAIGLAFLILGIVILFVLFGLELSRLQSERGFLLGASLGLLSVGLGFIAIGMSAKSDRRHSDLLQRLDRNLLKVLDQFEPELDTVESPKVQTITPKPVEVKTGVGKARVEVGEPKVEKGSKKEAQKRLDEDTKRVGYIRGEIYQLEDGTWGVQWGGKYPL